MNIVACFLCFDLLLLNVIISWDNSSLREADSFFRSWFAWLVSNYVWLKNTDVTEIVSQLEIADAIFSAGETKAEKSVCSPRARTIVSVMYATVMIRFSARGDYLLLVLQGRALIRDKGLIRDRELISFLRNNRMFKTKR